MCGIVCILSDCNADAQELLRLQMHRGPDGAGVTQLGSATIGMCRLRIRDHSKLTLPIAMNDGIFAYNGEVYGRDQFDDYLPASCVDELQLLHDQSLNGRLMPDGMYAVVATRVDFGVPHVRKVYWQHHDVSQCIFRLSRDNRSRESHISRRARFGNSRFSRLPSAKSNTRHFGTCASEVIG
jgi:hypothetical protein